nr:MAG TPA: hypothetical protein [Bacteriophage sp.]
MRVCPVSPRMAPVSWSRRRRGWCSGRQTDQRPPSRWKR